MLIQKKKSIEGNTDAVSEAQENDSHDEWKTQTTFAEPQIEIQTKYAMTGNTTALFVKDLSVKSRLSTQELSIT